MSWFGKLIGGSWGLLFGGPIGAIIGGVLGHYLFDRRVSGTTPRISFRGRETTAYNTEQVQAAYFVAVFSIFARIAQADGVVSSEERRLVEQLASQNSVGAGSRDFAMRVFDEAQHSPYSVRDFARQLATITHGRPDIRHSFLDTLFRIAAVDGTVHAAEIEAIATVAHEIGLAGRVFDDLRARYTGDDDERPYTVLGCRSDSSDSEVRSAYRRLVSEYHPDRIIARGLPDEFIELANDRFREIQEAYEQVKRTRGIA